MEGQEVKDLQTAFHDLPMEERSINQHLNLPYQPIFLPIEVKRLHQPRDPLIQLAVWVAAGYNKNLQAGYETIMPVPAISVDGDSWTLWIAYWQRGSIVFLGPTIMGTTLNALGVFQILSTLEAIADWGLKAYKPWFGRAVLRKHRVDLGKV